MTNQKTTEPRPAIFAAIAKAIDQIAPIAKERFNDQQKYKFRGVDDVYSALSPVLAKCDLVMTPTVLEYDAKEVTTGNGKKMLHILGKIQYRFSAIDGSFVDTVVLAEAFDSGDKAAPKFMSCGFKYAAFQVFCIAAGEQIDTENDSHERKSSGGSNRRGSRGSGQGGGSSEPRRASEKQVKMMMARAKEARLEESAFRDIVESVTGKRTTGSILKNQVDRILEGIKAAKVEPEDYSQDDGRGPDGEPRDQGTTNVTDDDDLPF